MKKLKIALVSLSLIPLISYAQGTALRGTNDIAEGISRLVDILTPIAFVAALLFFFWGVAQYIRKAGTEKEEGRMIMVWGIVALFVISSVWGLVFFIRDEIGVDDNNDINIPGVIINE